MTCRQPFLTLIAVFFRNFDKKITGHRMYLINYSVDPRMLRMIGPNPDHDILRSINDNHPDEPGVTQCLNKSDYSLSGCKQSRKIDGQYA